MCLIKGGSGNISSTESVRLVVVWVIPLYVAYLCSLPAPPAGWWSPSEHEVEPCCVHLEHAHHQGVYKTQQVKHVHRSPPLHDAAIKRPSPTLLKSKYLPILLYCTEACKMSNGNVKSFDVSKKKQIFTTHADIVKYNVKISLVLNCQAN